MKICRACRNGLVTLALVLLVGNVSKADEAADKLASLKKLRESIPSLHALATSTAKSELEVRNSTIELWEIIKDGKQKSYRTIRSVVNPGTEQETMAYPILMVKDGENAFREISRGEKKSVFRGKAKLHTEYDDMQRVLSRGVLSIKDGTEVLGEPTDLVEIAEKANPKDIIATYWVSRKNGLVLKSVVKGLDGRVTETTMSEYQIGIDIPDSKFSYKPPGGAQVIEEKGG